MSEPSPVPDNTLQRAAAGDRQAWKALLEQHGPLVWTLCRRLAADPEDCYQEVWEKVFRSLHGFDPHGRASLRTWIATVTNRHLIDRHRRRQTRGEVVPIGQLPTPELAQDERFAARQRAARLEAAIGRLPEAQRRVVVLHHIHGLSLDQLAAEERVAVGTIKSRLHRGRARLAQLLGGDR